MSKLKNGGLDQYGKVQSLNGIDGEWVKATQQRKYTKHCHEQLLVFARYRQLHNQQMYIATSYGTEPTSIMDFQPVRRMSSNKTNCNDKSGNDYAVGVKNLEVMFHIGLYMHYVLYTMRDCIS